MCLQRKKKNKGFVIAGLFLSGLVGAGFGSGREIFVYFASFGPVGIGGVILSCAVLWLASVWILEIAVGQHFTGVDQISKFVAKGKMATFYTMVILLFSFTGYVAMISGIRDVLEPVFPAVARRFPILFGICTGGIVVAFSLLALYSNFAAYSRICAIVTPCVIFCVAAVSVFAAFYAPSGPLAPQWDVSHIGLLFLKSFFYIGYNLLFLLGILGRAGALSASGSEIRKGSLLGAGLFFACGTCILVALCTIRPEIAHQAMPLPAVIGTFGALPKQIFSCVLALTMLLCSACNLGAVGSVLGQKSFMVPLLALAGIPLSCVGFDSVVSGIYPVFGVVGILFLLALAQRRGKIV